MKVHACVEMILNSDVQYEAVVCCAQSPLTPLQEARILVEIFPHRFETLDFCSMLAMLERQVIANRQAPRMKHLLARQLNCFILSLKPHVPVLWSSDARRSPVERVLELLRCPGLYRKFSAYSCLPCVGVRKDRINLGATCIAYMQFLLWIFHP